MNETSNTVGKSEGHLLLRQIQIGNLAHDACMAAGMVSQARGIADYLNGLEDASELLGRDESEDFIWHGNVQHLIGTMDSLTFRGVVFVAEPDKLVAVGEVIS